MPVTDFGILADGTWGPRFAPDGTRTYAVRLFAKTDVEMTGPEVLASAGMPVKFGSHADVPEAYCVAISEAIQDVDDATYWTIDYDYSTRVPEFAQAATSASGGPTGGGESDPQHNDADPLDRRPVIKLRNKKFKRLVFTDLDGDAIVNAAGVPFEAHTLEVSRLVIDVTRNVPDWDYTLLNLCEDGVNESSFIGYAARRVWCMELTADIEWQQNQSYWKLHGQFVVGNDDDILTTDPARGGAADAWWYEWKLNAGYDALDETTGVLTPIFLPGGQRPARPVLLNLFGERLAASQLGNPIFLGFRVKRDAPLHALGLFN